MRMRVAHLRAAVASALLAAVARAVLQGDRGNSVSHVRVMDGGFLNDVLDGTGLGEAKTSSQEEAIKAKIEQEKAAEARAIQNEGAAEKVLNKVVKTGSVADYNTAQATVQNLARETALQTLKGMGYKCTGPAAAIAKSAEDKKPQMAAKAGGKTEPTAKGEAKKPAPKEGARAEQSKTAASDAKPEGKKPAAKAEAATGKQAAKEAAKPAGKPGAATKEASKPAAAKPAAKSEADELGELKSELQHVDRELPKLIHKPKKPKEESLRQMKATLKGIASQLEATPVSGAVELVQEMVGYGDAGGADAMLAKAKQKTDIATEKLMNMEKELSGMEGAAKSAQQ